MSVSHHGEDEARKLMELFQAQQQGKAQREYPNGRLNADDDGALAMAIAADQATKTVVIKFAKPTDWIGLGAKECFALAQLLIQKGREVATEPMQIEIH
jgi:hypothetical protein